MFELCLNLIEISDRKRGLLQHLQYGVLSFALLILLSAIPSINLCAFNLKVFKMQRKTIQS